MDQDQTSDTHGSLGTFDFDSVGRLSSNLPAGRLGMEFTWRGRAVQTALRTIGDGPTGIMSFRTQAGRMPSSAIAADARPDAFQLASHLPALLPPHWTVQIRADHTVQVQADTEVAMPALITDLLVPAVQFCLQASPYFDLLEENAMGMQA